MKIKDNIGEILQEYRVKSGLSQNDMSKLTGVTKNHLSAIERNLFKINFVTALMYIGICKIPISEFFEKEKLK